VIDSPCDSIAVLDEHGLIISVNHAWQTFAVHHGGSAELAAGIGIDYLAAVRSRCRQRFVCLCGAAGQRSGAGGTADAVHPGVPL
jgi:hypothetical protein